MKTTFGFSACYFSLSVLATLTAPSASACVNPGENFFRWENCTSMVVYPDSSLSSIPAGTGSGAGGDSVQTQLGSAVTAWYDSISAFGSISTQSIRALTAAPTLLLSTPLFPQTQPAGKPTQAGLWPRAQQLR
jgi:hypothetical protein